MVFGDIDPQILKTIRKARKLSRSRLAKMTGLTERKIARFEMVPSEVPPALVARIADALSVPDGVLNGSLDITEQDLVPASELSCDTGGCGCC